MNHPTRLFVSAGALFVALLACPVAALATAFDFSYAFQDGTVVSGAFDGTQNGNFVENITNVSVLFSDTPQPGPAGPIYTATLSAGLWVNGPVVSFNALDNNFSFSNQDLVGNNYVNGWGFFMIGSLPQVTNYYGPNNLATYDRNYSIVSNNWSLTARQGNGVPDGGSTLVLIGGALSLAGFLRRRQTC